MKSQSRWSTKQIGDLSGKRFLITGSNSGIGFEAAKMIAGHGGEVVMACRNSINMELAANEIKKEFPSAHLGFVETDLASLESIRNAANFVNEQYGVLDGLINNAGVMWLPQRETADGFEMHIGTNHLGHFALTGLLLPSLRNASNARVVSVSSLAHWAGHINLQDIHHRQDYRKNPVYAQSKLANLLFAYELQRRLEQKGEVIISVAAHPGVSATNLSKPGFEMERQWLLQGLTRIVAPVLTQKASKGALPVLCAALGADVKGGEYYGPSGYRQFWGEPKKVRSSAEANDVEIAQQLWALSESETGVRYWEEEE